MRLPTIKDYLPLLRFAIFQNSLYFSNGMSWRPGQQKFVPVNVKKFKVWGTSVFAASLLIVLSIRMKMILGDSEKNGGGQMKNIVSVLFLSTYIHGYFMGLVGYKKRKDITDLYNTLLHFEDAQEQNVKLQRRKFSIHQGKTVLSNLVHLGKTIAADLKRGEVGRCMLIVIITSEASMALLIIMYLGISPCSDPIFFRTTLSDCPVRSGFITVTSSLPLKILFPVVDSFLVLYTYSTAMYSAVVIYYLAVLCVAEKIRSLKKLSLTADQAQFFEALKVYKQLKIVETCINNINRSANIPLMISDITIACIITMYSCVALHSKLSVPIFLFVVMLGIDVYVFGQGVMYQGGGTLHQHSKELLDIWKHSQTARKSKLLRRQINCSNLIKIRIGNSGNFLEKTTPLVATQFSVEQSISLVLMSN